MKCLVASVPTPAFRPFPCVTGVAGASASLAMAPPCLRVAGRLLVGLCLRRVATARAPLGVWVEEVLGTGRHYPSLVEASLPVELRLPVSVLTPVLLPMTPLAPGMLLVALVLPVMSSTLPCRLVLASLPSKRSSFVRVVPACPGPEERHRSSSGKNIAASGAKNSQQGGTTSQSGSVDQQHEKWRSRYLRRMKGLCFNCLAQDHKVASCYSLKRCWQCYHYGHISTVCPSRRVERPTSHSVEGASAPLLSSAHLIMRMYGVGEGSSMPQAATLTPVANNLSVEERMKLSHPIVDDVHTPLIDRERAEERWDGIEFAVDAELPSAANAPSDDGMAQH
ncbi:hypothetical protein PR202_gb23306 [Eleusine coracana subsp. coracana]|uniref:CCHC-type domain-containing protein n=1 Tax=Eleusine coracana subsp. coracana TaxID=191504 RepID=A0AAV5FIH6_ELECO|nr:hypothetical protein PR202_gb23306 [Eleusine coracana subsp. coracana]